MEVILKKGIGFVIALCMIGAVSPEILALESVTARNTIELPDEAVSKKILENGLTLLAKNSPSNDLIAIDVEVKAGSSLEEEFLGTGISHLVEHMLFKGTSSRKPGDVEKEIKSYGGFINGSAGQDLTSYHLTVRSKYLRESLLLLKDILLNASFDRDEMEKEKQVILSELRLDNDEPQSRIYRFLNETAYIRHTYKYPVIGYEEAFKRLTQEDALKYYNRMYAPNRIVVSIVGNADASSAIKEGEAIFKDFRLPDYRVIGLSPVEPAQIAKRYLEAEAQTNLAYLAMGFHSSSLLDEDLFAMDVLSMILGRGNNSRLNVSLYKNKKIAHSIACWNYTPRDPGLFVVTAILDKDNLDKAEQAVADEIRAIREDPVLDAELENAKRMVLSDFIFALQTIDAQAADLSTNYILTGSYDFSRRYVQCVQSVTKDDIIRVADIYLRPGNLTIVRLVPAGEKAPETGLLKSPAEEPALKKEVLPNGLVILLRENRKTPTLSITAAASGGVMVEDKADNGISNLAAGMLMKGTASRNEGQIEGAIEALGGSIKPFSGANSFGITIEILRPDIDIALDILKDIIADSTCPQDELDKEKTFALAMIKEDDDDIFKRGVNLLKKEIFGDSPYALRYLGEENSIRALKRGDVIIFYKTYLVPNNLVISISGDFESAGMSKKLNALFGSLKKAKVPARKNFGARLDKVNSESLNMDKEQSLYLIGFETAGIENPDRYALEVLGSVLSGYSGRLFSLRDKQSLAYALGCAQKMMLKRGLFAFYVATTKEKIEEVKKSLFDQIRMIREKPVSLDELDLAKRELKSGRGIDMQANQFVSYTGALDEMYGLGYDNLYKYDAEIEKVTGEDLKRIADKYLAPNAYGEVIITPVKK